jgi:hypothetical protein
VPMNLITPPISYELDSTAFTLSVWLIHLAYFLCVVLEFELRTYTLSHSTSPF